MVKVIDLGIIWKGFISWAYMPMPYFFIGFFKVPVQHRHQAILSVLPWPDPSMAQWDLNSQPRLKVFMTDTQDKN